MPELTVGLAPNRSSYYDKKTNTYITLAKPVQKIAYTSHVEIEGIVHALFSSNPALVLYEGKVPQEAIDAFKDKYERPFYTDMTKLRRNLVGDLVPPTDVPNRAFDRPEVVNEKSADNEVGSFAMASAEMKEEPKEVVETKELQEEQPEKKAAKKTAKKEDVKEEKKEAKPKKTSKKTASDK